MWVGDGNNVGNITGFTICISAREGTEVDGRRRILNAKIQLKNHTSCFRAVSIKLYVHILKEIQHLRTYSVIKLGHTKL